MEKSPFSLYTPAESLWILTWSYVESLGGQKKHPNLAKAEQTWNFDLGEGNKIPPLQSGSNLCRTHIEMVMGCIMASNAQTASMLSRLTQNQIILV